MWSRLGARFSITASARSFSDVDTGSRSANATIHYVDPDFFAVTGVQVISGRPFSQFDDHAREAVCLVSAELARHLDAPEHVRADRQDCRVIGITSSEEIIPGQSLGSAIFRPRITLVAITSTGVPPVSSIFLKSRLGEPPANASDAILALLPPEARTREMIWSSTHYWAARRQIVTGLSLLVSALSTVLVGLAAAGLASTLSLDVLARRSEIGLRIALGATRSDIFAMVTQDGLITALRGGLAGVMLGALLTQFAIGPFFASTELLPMRVDPKTVVVTAFVLGLAAICATIGPSWRATRIDPTLALRNL